jgi:hypothetical protein
MLLWLVLWRLALVAVIVRPSVWTLLLCELRSVCCSYGLDYVASMRLHGCFYGLDYVVLVLSELCVCLCLLL